MKVNNNNITRGIKNMAEWQKLTFDVPIKESLMANEEFMIKGTAINETTTRNGVTYLAEELAPSAKTLRNKPILKDHTNSVDSIVGRTTKNVNYDEETKSILFEGIIKDEDIKNKINEGLIDSVSVGAMVRDIEETDDDRLIVRGIDFVEISLVAVPADKNATFTRAVTESFTLKKKVSEEIQKKTIQEEKSKMAEENVELNKELEATNVELLKELEVFRTEKIVREAEELEQLQHEYKIVVESLKLEARNVEGISKETLSILIEDLKKVQEQAEAEDAEEEVEEDAEEEVEDADAEVEVQEEKMKGKVNKEKTDGENILDEFVFTTEEVSKGYGLYKEEFDNPKLKR